MKAGSWSIGGLLIFFWFLIVCGLCFACPDDSRRDEPPVTMRF